VGWGPEGVGQLLQALYKMTIVGLLAFIVDSLFLARHSVEFATQTGITTLLQLEQQQQIAAQLP